MSLQSISYLKQQAALLNINLGKDDLSRDDIVLLLCKNTLTAITNALFDNDINLGEIKKAIIRDILIKDVNSMINLLRNYKGKNRRGISAACKELDQAYITLTSSLLEFNNSEKRIELLVRSRNSLSIAKNKLSHI